MMRHTFGPGSLESVTLETRMRHVGFERVQVRIVGSFTVYCALGNEHTVDVSCKYVDASDVASAAGMSRVITTPDAVAQFADAYADQLIEWQLEDWSDPCDVEWDHPVRTLGKDEE